MSANDKSQASQPRTSDLITLSKFENLTIYFCIIFVYCDGLFWQCIACSLTLTPVLHALICLKNQKFGEHGLKTKI